MSGDGADGADARAPEQVDMKMGETGGAPAPMSMRRAPVSPALLKHQQCAWECVMVGNKTEIIERNPSGPNKTVTKNLEGIGNTWILVAHDMKLFCYDADASEGESLKYEFHLGDFSVNWSNLRGHNVLKLARLHFEGTDTPDNSAIGLIKYLTQHTKRSLRTYYLDESDIDISVLGAEYGPPPCLTVGFLRAELPGEDDRKFICGWDDEEDNYCCFFNQPLLSWEVITNYTSCWFPCWNAADQICMRTPCCWRLSNREPFCNPCCVCCCFCGFCPLGTQSEEEYVFPLCAVGSHHVVSVPHSAYPRDCIYVPGLGLVAGALFCVMATPVAAGSLCCPSYCAVKIVEIDTYPFEEEGRCSREYWRSAVYESYDTRPRQSFKYLRNDIMILYG